MKIYVKLDFLLFLSIFIILFDKIVIVKALKFHTLDVISVF